MNHVAEIDPVASATCAVTIDSRREGRRRRTSFTTPAIATSASPQSSEIATSSATGLVAPGPAKEQVTDGGQTERAELLRQRRPHGLKRLDRQAEALGTAPAVRPGPVAGQDRAAETRVRAGHRHHRDPSIGPGSRGTRRCLREVVEPEQAECPGAGVRPDDGSERGRDLDLRGRPSLPDHAFEHVQPVGRGCLREPDPQ